ncbi:acyl-CoA dehydrogenase family protein [Actinacidiphila yeochonensis]|uniref:acyl-CoA dehydrogenase family protein n=1 Tax=Actinacidiphila yeochonensis TaxID=89050 RepID=UPI00056627FE|nr:acyl-CoA dehydrogenase family protein [Actinacidiphila yeochonensis]
MHTTAKPTSTELAARAAGLVPVLREHADWSERNRRLSDEAVEALKDAGVLRMRVPARFGGYESSASDLLDVGIELGRGDGAVAFTVAVWWITSWNVGLFSDEAQDEVFADPDARISGTLVIGGTAEQRPGGIRVNGRWSFNSGAAHSTWKLLSVLAPTADGDPEPVMAVVPMRELRMIDDWEVAGLRGTGSVTVAAEDVFVPAARCLSIPAFTRGEYASKLNAGLPMFHTPLVGAVAASTTGKIIGMARAGAEDFFERVQRRPITNTTYERQADAPITHLQAGEAMLQIDEAEGHARRLAALIDGKAGSGAEWTLRERAYVRAVAGRVPRLGADAADLLAGASGASSLYTDQLIQRVRRNLQAVTVHSLHLPTATAELYGRVLCGLEPNTFFI